jgi:hypothetical protein
MISQKKGWISVGAPNHSFDLLHANKWDTIIPFGNKIEIRSQASESVLNC